MNSTPPTIKVSKVTLDILILNILFLIFIIIHFIFN